MQHFGLSSSHSTPGWSRPTGHRILFDQPPLPFSRLQPCPHQGPLYLPLISATLSKHDSLEWHQPDLVPSFTYLRPLSPIQSFYRQVSRVFDPFLWAGCLSRSGFYPSDLFVNGVGSALTTLRPVQLLACFKCEPWEIQCSIRPWQWTQIKAHWTSFRPP